MSNYICVICHETLVDPITFMCQHTFCRHCVYTLKTCPTCRLAIFIPPCKNNLLIDAIIREIGAAAYETRTKEVAAAAAELSAQQLLEYNTRAQIWREVVGTVGTQNQRVIEIHAEPKTQYNILYPVLIGSAALIVLIKKLNLVS